jgi:hypothetical protein
MRTLPRRFPLLAALFEETPELSSLAILDTALLACEGALLAANPELMHGQLDDCHRGSAAIRANALIVQARRLSTALAAYREAVDRDTRRRAREEARRGF